MKAFTKIGYEYSELSETAKEIVKSWYLDDYYRGEMLTEDFQEAYLNYFFSENDLKVQWSLSSCQGDGVNIYGNLDLNSIVTYIKNYNPAEHGYKYAHDPRGIFAEKEIKRINWYINNLRYTGSEINIPSNNHYCYCIANKIDFAEDIIDDLEYQNFKNIDKDLINRFQDETIEIIQGLCGEMENNGYQYLYDCDDKEVEEICQANEYYFDEDGNLI